MAPLRPHNPLWLLLALPLCACTVDFGPDDPACGNGVLEQGESCDGSDFGDRTCQSEGHPGGDLACTVQCSLDLTGCTLCGNGAVDDGEACDGSDFADQTCLSAANLQDGELTCTSVCTLDISNCHHCGDGAVNGPEQCEGTNLMGADCANVGLSGGELACGPNCRFDTSGCWDCGDGQCDSLLGETHVQCPADCDPMLIGAFGQYTCAVNTASSMVCWGRNDSGQLGTGTTQDASTAVPVVGLGAVVDLDAGFRHTCAVDQTGQAYCWGAGGAGQVGDGTTVERHLPTPVVGMTAAAQIDAGHSHSCAVDDAQTVYCWGSNNNGALGNDSLNNSAVPVQTLLGEPATQIACGGYHNCAVTVNNDLWCWGQNFYGQLGINSLTTQRTPVSLGLDSPGVARVAAGDGHTCAVYLNGSLWCWGNNSIGQVGIGDWDPQIRVPTEVTTLSDVNLVAAGGSHSCAVTTDGNAWCWGANGYGQLGTGDNQMAREPVAVVDLMLPVQALATGAHHTCVMLTDSTVWCWGAGGQGQLGNYTTSNSYVPVQVHDVP